ncbi:MAG: hexose kinase [Actinomycetota bacterium]|nr:hexose kinase [Actinomycetota bacterium]
MLIVGPNLTLDRTLSLPELRPGEVLRFSKAAITPGGKGVNVARVARSLALPAHLVGFAAGRTGRAVAELVADEDLAQSAVPVGGEVRSSAIVVEEDGRITVLNEPGPSISESDWERLETATEERLGDHRILVCIGSSPPGTPRDGYARLVEHAHRASVPVLVDAAGDLLAAALEAGPDFVTPNLGEAEGALEGHSVEETSADTPDAPEHARVAAAALVRRGAGVALVTAGGAGVAVDGSAGAWWIEAPAVKVVNPIGAGDAFVGGFCGALERGAAVREAATEAVATASASVETATAGGVDPVRVRALIDGMHAG